jgi:hypothetical protein
VKKKRFHRPIRETIKELFYVHITVEQQYGLEHKQLKLLLLNCHFSKRYSSDRLSECWSLYPSEGWTMVELSFPDAPQFRKSVTFIGRFQSFALCPVRSILTINISAEHLWNDTKSEVPTRRKPSPSATLPPQKPHEQPGTKSGYYVKRHGLRRLMFGWILKKTSVPNSQKTCSVSATKTHQ